jgi:hypothetical protein
MSTVLCYSMSSRSTYTGTVYIYNNMYCTVHSYIQHKDEYLYIRIVCKCVYCISYYIIMYCTLNYTGIYEDNALCVIKGHVTYVHNMLYIIPHKTCKNKK